MNLYIINVCRIGTPIAAGAPEALNLQEPPRPRGQLPPSRAAAIRLTASAVFS